MSNFSWHKLISEALSELRIKALFTSGLICMVIFVYLQFIYPVFKTLVLEWSSEGNFQQVIGENINRFGISATSKV